MKTLLMFLAITAAALTIAYYAVGAVNPSGLCSADWTEAQIVREHCHLRLIQPEWVSSKGSIMMNWIIAETKARLGVIAFFWLCAVIYTVRLEVHGNDGVNAN